MTPFRVYGRIETLYMTPPGVSIILVVCLVTKGDAGNIFRSKKSFEGFGNYGLGFPLG
jgi:hypothetical protein